MNVGCDDTRICSNYKMGEPWGGPPCGNYVPKPTPAPDVVAELRGMSQNTAPLNHGPLYAFKHAADLVAPVLASKDAEIADGHEVIAESNGIITRLKAQLAEAQHKLVQLQSPSGHIAARKVWEILRWESGQGCSLNTSPLYKREVDALNDLVNNAGEAQSPPGYIAAVAVEDLLDVKDECGAKLRLYDVTLRPVIDRIKVLVAAAGDPVCAGITRTTLAGMPVIIDPSLPDGAFRIIGREGTYEFIAGPAPCPNAPCVSVAVLGWILGVALNSARFNANYGLSRIPEYIQAALRKEAADDCPDCKGYGTDSSESDYGCTTCKGTGNRPQEAADEQ